MFALRRNLTIALLLIVSIWPIVHAVISAALDWSGWKGGGWAMYTVPRRLVEGEPFAMQDGRPLRIETIPNADRVALIKAWDHYSRRRLEFGYLVKPDVFARELLRCYPGVDEVKIVVHLYGINRGTAITELESTEEYVYTRDQFKE